MPSKSEIAVLVTLQLLKKSGVQEWASEQHRLDIAQAANQIADLLYSSGGSMALPDKFLTVVGNPHSFADHAGDFSPANSLEFGTPVDVQLSLTGVATGAAQQSAKTDLGENRAEVYDVTAAIELAATPTAGAVISFYWAPSPNATAGTANPGNVSGANAAYTGYSSNLAASLPQLQFIGDFVCTAQTTGTVQVARVGSFRPHHRYGSLVVVNNSGASIHSDDVECHVVMAPQLPQVQD